MATVIEGLEAARPGGRNAAMNAAAWTLGRWVAVGALELRDVEDTRYEAAEVNRLVDDDGDRKCWATIRSGLSAGLHEPIDWTACGAHAESTRISCAHDNEFMPTPRVSL